jgi:hypothetical protein
MAKNISTKGLLKMNSTKQFFLEGKEVFPLVPLYSFQDTATTEFISNFFEKLAVAANDRIIMRNQYTYSYSNYTDHGHLLVETNGPRTLPESRSRFFTPVILRKEGEYLTQLPKGLIDTLGEPVDLSNLNDNLWSIDTNYNLNNGNNTSGEVRHQTNQLRQHQVRLATVGSVSLLEHTQSEVKEAFRQIFYDNAPRRLKVLAADNLFKGTSTGNCFVTVQTKNQVLKGRAFFLFKQKVNIYDVRVGAYYSAPVLQLGIFTNPTSVCRYKNSRRLFINLLNALNTSSSFYESSEEYHQQLNKKLAGLNLYWNKIGNIVLDELQSQDISGLEDYQPVLELQKKAITDKNFNPIRMQRELETCPEVIDLEKVIQAQQQTKDRITEADGTLYSYSNQITSYKKRIEEMSNDITYYEDSAIKVEERKEILIKALEPLVEQEKEYQRIYQEKISNCDTQLPEMKVLENLQKSGIALIDVIYRDAIDQTISLNDLTEPPIRQKYSLSKVHFVTTKPIPIALNSYKYMYSKEEVTCKTVAGGPYEVIVTETSGSVAMSLRLASRNAVFGYNNKTAKIHPHTEDFTLSNIDDLYYMYKNFENACLGNARSAIVQGFEQNHPEMVVLAAYSWLSSCCTSDTWGKSASWFPAYSSLKTTEPLIDLIKREVVPDIKYVVLPPEESEEESETNIEETVVNEEENNLNEGTLTLTAGMSLLNDNTNITIVDDLEAHDLEAQYIPYTASTGSVTVNASSITMHEEE